MWKCPQPEKARQMGCLDIGSDDLCTRKNWVNSTYARDPETNLLEKIEVYCERIKAMPREV
jgi:hypothetical protein